MNAQSGGEVGGLPTAVGTASPAARYAQLRPPAERTPRVCGAVPRSGTGNPAALSPGRLRGRTAGPRLRALCAPRCPPPQAAGIRPAAARPVAGAGTAPEGPAARGPKPRRTMGAAPRGGPGPGPSASPRQRGARPGRFRPHGRGRHSPPDAAAAPARPPALTCGGRALRQPAAGPGPLGRAAPGGERGPAGSEGPPRGGEAGPGGARPRGPRGARRKEKG